MISTDLSKYEVGKKGSERADLIQQLTDGVNSERIETKWKPLTPRAIAVKVSLEVPDEIFDKPSLVAEIKIPKEAVSKPIISAEVIDNVQEIIKQNTGFEVKLEVVEKDKEETDES